MEGPVAQLDDLVMSWVNITLTQPKPAPDPARSRWAPPPPSNRIIDLTHNGNPRQPSVSLFEDDLFSISLLSY